MKNNTIANYIMKRVLIFVGVALSLCLASVFVYAHSNNAENPSPRMIPAEQTEYEISLLCPKCHKIMYAKFKKGYSSTTTAKCEKCYQRYTIRYNWPQDHKEPTIREIKESK